MLLCVPKGCGAVDAKTHAVVWLGEALEEIENGTTLPRFQIDFLLSCDEFLHSLMLIAESFTTHKGKKITVSELRPSQVLCHGF